MREDEKYLVEVPMAQMSRVSHLVRNLRSYPDEIKSLPSYDKFCLAVLDIETNGADQGFNDLLYAISDLISEAVWPRR